MKDKTYVYILTTEELLYIKFLNILNFVLMTVFIKNVIYIYRTMKDLH